MKFTDVNPFNKKIQKDINKSVLKTINKKDFILGENVRKFERNSLKYQIQNMQLAALQVLMLYYYHLKL